MGVESSSVVLAGSDLVATFDNGIPISAGASPVTLRFDHKTLDEQLIAISSADDLARDSDLSGSTSGLTCSFQGGCSYTVTASGLTSSLLSSDSNSIDFCGNPCIVDEGASSATETVCKLPYLSTAYSATEYEIVTTGVLHEGTWTGTASQSELAKLTDGKNMIDMTDSATTDCYF